MKLVSFAHTDREISQLCLSAMDLGWTTDGRMSYDILDTFCAHGGNFILAGSRTDPGSALVSEVHVGHWMEYREVMRDELMLATKLTVRPEAALTRPALVRFVRQSCEASLRDLRVEYLDLLLCEMRPAVLPVEVLLEALAPLTDEGLVRHVGASRFPVSRLRAANRVGDTLPRLAVVQDDYSLVARSRFETELAPVCDELGVAFLASSPLAGGFLTDAAGTDFGWTSVGRAMQLGRDRATHRAGWRDAIARLARARGASIAQTALAWVLGRPGVTSALVAVTSAAELRSLIAGLADPLTERMEAWLEDPLAHGSLPESPRHRGRSPATATVAELYA